MGHGFGTVNDVCQVLALTVFGPSGPINLEVDNAPETFRGEDPACQGLRFVTRPLISLIVKVLDGVGGRGQLDAPVK